MTEDDLAEIERQYEKYTPIFGIGEAEAHIPALIAEVRRLWQIEAAAREAAALDLGDDDYLLIDLRDTLETYGPRVLPPP